MIKINTNTIIKNLENKPLILSKDGDKETYLTVGDVLFSALGAGEGIELKASWALMPKLALPDNEIKLTDDDVKTLKNVVEQAAKRPVTARYNLIAYGKVMDILEGKVEKEEDATAKSDEKTETKE